MKCPVCNGVDLRIADRQGVEIDYCPQCRGVWLDRGELEKIIERSYIPSREPRFSEDYNHGHENRYSHGHDEHNEHRYDQDHHENRWDKHHKRKSLLKELFDF